MENEVKRGKVDIHLLQMQGTLIFTQRENLAEEALKWGAEYLMWVDSDMRFPKDTLEEMLKHNVDIVGVNGKGIEKALLFFRLCSFFDLRC
jgi:hypothetical protein